MIRENVDISEFSGFKTPAKARYYFEITSLDQSGELFDAYEFARKNDLMVLVISGGTNMLLAFDVFEGLVIKNNLQGYSLEDKILVAQSAHSIWEIAQELEDDHGIDLWHRFIGLPGSIGGAVYGNAGCFGLETENNFVSAKFLDTESGEVVEFSKSEMDFSYRNSRIKKEKKWFCLSATFDLSEKIEKYSSDVDNVHFRKHKQPNGLSCGSFFKNPSREQTAGYLIEQVGLKGHKIGGALLSEKHANFLMSDGTATWQELIELKDLAIEKVQEAFGVTLENEVQIITNR